MESAISTSGCNSLTASRMSVICVSERMYSPSGSTPSRRARSFSCRSLSSPDTYRTFRPWHRQEQICSSSVDLPMPGAPPTSTRLPPTAPPPRTRSSSPMPVEKRISPSVSTWDSFWGRRLPPTGADLARPGAAGFSVCSSRVFQAPQAGQRPCHLGVSFPHSVQ